MVFWVLSFFSKFFKEYVCLQNVNIASEDSESEDELRPDDVPKNGTTKTSLIKSKTNSGYEVKPYFMENCEASKYKTVPSKLEPKQLQRDELDDLLQVERQWKDHEKPYQTLPNHVGSNTQVSAHSFEL